MNWANAAERDPEADEHELDRKPGGEKRPLSRKLWPRPSRSITASSAWLTATKAIAAARPATAKREVVGRADGIDGEPRRQVR